eukprot:CAMPEP_0202438482 /NCGR_PEP_ID=MMETSP1345-20130828/33762_1 /ASSEMBLY_ACC=CAM_ASM_000843 /TAXON_ID=342563 /ORGANISM="Fabrea Fabrea salina" /LENGTH=96 /DNA_ID=CAMNT_0049052705 /DNA_START=281 /DNA_END=568 /DNA_ORIENTATION=+
MKKRSQAAVKNRFYYFIKSKLSKEERNYFIKKSMIPPRINLEIAALIEDEADEDKVVESFLSSFEAKPEFYDLESMGVIEKKKLILRLKEKMRRLE